MHIHPVRVLLSLLALAAVPAFAVTRTLTITPPAAVKAGEEIYVAVAASTDANDGEQIGFFQPEYSVDGGKNWTPAYVEKAGRSVTRGLSFRVGQEGSTVLVRLRAAFRGGKSGDVDVSGAPLPWGGAWGKWEAPTAKQVSIKVAAR